MNPLKGREDELENALNRGALWAVTYGDMMSYLMIFFLVLFSLYFGGKAGAGGKDTAIERSMINIEKIFGGQIDPKRLERLERLDEEESLAYRLKESQEVKDLSSFVQIQSNEENIRLVLPEAISFDSGKAALKEEAKPLLALLARLVKGLPNNVVIEGHTDSLPINNEEFRNNFYLSMARAYHVMDELMKEGIDPKRLSGQGYGENRPAADNGTDEGRAKNRRVEIVLVRIR